MYKIGFTDGKDRYKKYPWFIELNATASNRLDKDSEVDASQVKSLSVDRFHDKLGVATDAQIQQVAAAIALCVGYEPETP
jgi:mRNA-degrading endonuclease toxin of MazEF toxin-antitoxin module